MNAFIALLRKDLILHFSNRRAVIMSFFAPIFIAAFFGSLFGGSGGTPSGVAVAVVDLDRSAASARILAALHADKTLAITEPSAEQAPGLVQAGKVRAAVTLPAGFAAQARQALFSGGGSSVTKPQIDIRYDPSQATTLPLVRGLLMQHVMAGLSGGTAGGTGFSAPFTTNETESAGLFQAHYNGYAHSFAGMGVQFLLLMGVDMGLGLLLMRRMGLWQRLRAAPLSRATLLGSRIASCALIALIVFAGVYAVAFTAFGVRIEGSVAGFVAVLVAFSLLTASFGLLIAAIGRTPEATRGLAILATLLMVMLGGAWVPTFIFPPWLQQASLFVPTHWAVEGLDAMTWRGLPFSASLLPVGLLLAFSAAFSGLALWRFRWDE
jgi:ABC-2 type transport system permease protein